MLLGLAVANPDAWITRHNVERHQATGRVDWGYLQQLSADDLPELIELPSEQVACAVADDLERHGWAGWNLSRSRASALLRSLDLPTDGVLCAWRPEPLG